jgi:hypothetical protein
MNTSDARFAFNQRSQRKSAANCIKHPASTRSFGSRGR